MRIVFSVQGSADEPYQLTVNSLSLKMSCNCAAGKKKQLCKHLLGLIVGDYSDHAVENAMGCEDFFRRLKSSEIMVIYDELRQLNLKKDEIDNLIRLNKKKLMKAASD